LLRELASPDGNATGILEENETWKGKKKKNYKIKNK